MDRLKNKVAVVTGAADGIGLAIAQAFVEEGATVVMADINEEKCKKEAQKLSEEGNAQNVLCDVGNSTDVQKLIEGTITGFGAIDILVNNAAIAVSGCVSEMPEDDWDLVMNTNLKSVYRTIKSTLPHMIKQKSGSIINISSAQAFRSWDDWTAYAAAKGGMTSMTNQLAGQFGNENVRFNTISPGAILTPMAEVRAKSEGPEFLEMSIKNNPMLRMGEPGEVAMTAVFLASDEACYLTGENIVIDGGLTSLPGHSNKSKNY